MSDTVLTQTQLENLFQSLTSTILNTTDPSVVRISWPTDGSPSWSINQDICFVQVTPVDNGYNQQMMTDYSVLDANTANANLTYTAGVRVSWTLYGPSASDNADVIRYSLFTDSTTSTLMASNVALVTDVPMPIRSPELFNGEWWNRASLYANFNELVIRTSTVPVLQTADVQVKPDYEIEES